MPVDHSEKEDSRSSSLPRDTAPKPSDILLQPPLRCCKIYPQEASQADAVFILPYFQRAEAAPKPGGFPAQHHHLQLVYASQHLLPILSWQVFCRKPECKKKTCSLKKNKNNNKKNSWGPPSSNYILLSCFSLCVKRYSQLL